MDKKNEENIKQLQCLVSKGMPYQNGSLLIVAIANLLADGLDSNEINLLSNFLQAVGQMLGYIAAQKDLNDA